MLKKMSKFLKEYFYISLGSLLLAVGLLVFLIPGKLSSGGISSIGTVLLYLADIPLFITSFILNAVLFILGWKYLEKRTILKTVAGILFTSLFLALYAVLPVYGEDILLASILGGILIGAGLGLVIRQEASTGGSDFAALILHRFFPHISVAHWILLIDFGIIAISGLVFKSAEITFYSAIALVVSMRVADLILSYGNAAKSICVFSYKTNEIAEFIKVQFSRGSTGIYCQGMYTKQDSMMLLSVVTPKEAPILIRQIHHIDKNAFIIISDVREVLGEGFKKI